MGIHEEIIVAGFGGQGVLAMGRLMAYAGMIEGKNVSWLPSYGPEMRGGTANCSVILSDELVGCPVISRATCLIAMNGPSLDKFESAVAPGGKIIVNSSLIKRKVERTDVEAVYCPVSDTALELGDVRGANMIMLGAYIGLTGFPSPEKVKESLLKVFGEGKKKLIPMNEAALNKGMEMVK